MKIVKPNNERYTWKATVETVHPRIMFVNWDNIIKAIDESLNDRYPTYRVSRPKTLFSCFGVNGETRLEAALNSEDIIFNVFKVSEVAYQSLKCTDVVSGRIEGRIHPHTEERLIRPDAKILPFPKRDI